MNKKFLSAAMACVILAATAVSTVSASAEEFNTEPAQAVYAEQTSGYENLENMDISLAWKYDKKSGDYWYNVKADNTSEAVIVGYVGNKTEVTVPEKIDGKTVTKLGVDAFSKTHMSTAVEMENIDKITKVTVPESVTEITAMAFYCLPSLKSVVILNPKAEIDDMAIYNGPGDDDLINITVYGRKNSTAEKYATQREFQKINFEVLRDADHGYYGDVDYDNKITSADALYVLRASVGLENPDSNTRKLADVNGDGFVDSSDSLMILRHSVGLKDNGSLITL